MAETQPKRQRGESHEADVTNSKRHKSYDNILSILNDEEEEEPNQDFSAIFTTLQQELSSSFSSPPCPSDEAGPKNNQATATSADCSPSSAVGAQELENEEVKDDNNVGLMLRRLLEASDDELGIPNVVDEEIKFEENRPFCDGLWELEDEVANYYNGSCYTYKMVYKISYSLHTIGVETTQPTFLNSRGIRTFCEGE